MDSQLFQKIQKGLIDFLFVTAVAALIMFPDSSTRAPLLTLIGGLVILVPMLKLNKLELLQVAPILGILVATGGTYFWLSEATGGKAGITLAELFLGTVALIVMGAIVFAFVWVLVKTDSREDPEEMIRASRLRRAKRELREVADETRTTGFNEYTKYDPVIAALFRNIWSMLNNPHLSTYAWKEHKNLIENYAVATLERTAEIAITKHPYQCKYGEIATSLAYDIVRGLLPVRVIRALILCRIPVLNAKSPSLAIRQTAWPQSAGSASTLHHLAKREVVIPLQLPRIATYHNYAFHVVSKRMQSRLELEGSDCLLSCHREALSIFTNT